MAEKEYIERGALIKALECCKKDDCDSCPNNFGNCYANLAGYALDLIKRQQAEIERLTVNMNAFGLGMKREAERAETARTEAIKEFAERLKVEMIDKKYKYVTETNYSKTVNAVIDACIVATDTLAKEMTEGQNNV